MLLVSECHQAWCMNNLHNVINCSSGFDTVDWLKHFMTYYLDMALLQFVILSPNDVNQTFNQTKLGATKQCWIALTDLQEKNSCFLYRITICKVAPLCEIYLSCELLQMPYSTYRLKEIYINMPKKNKNTKPLLYQILPSSKAAHLGLICSM